MLYYQKPEIKERLLIPQLYILVHFQQQVFFFQVKCCRNKLHKSKLIGHREEQRSKETLVEFMFHKNDWPLTFVLENTTLSNIISPCKKIHLLAILNIQSHENKYTMVIADKNVNQCCCVAVCLNDTVCILQGSTVQNSLEL